MMARIRHDKQTCHLWLHCHIKEHACPQKPAFTALSERIGGGIQACIVYPTAAPASASLRLSRALCLCSSSCGWVFVSQAFFLHMILKSASNRSRPNTHRMTSAL